MSADLLEANLPELPFLRNDDSMLTRKFGKEVINYYAGARLNRISFLRPDSKFLRQAAISPGTKYLALKNLDPLVTQDKKQLAYFNYEDVKSLVGTEVFALSEDDYIKQYDSTVTTPTIIFLGLLDKEAGGSDEPFESTKHGEVKGDPYFAVDVTPKGSYAQAAEEFAKKWEDAGYQFQNDSRSFKLPAELGMLLDPDCSSLLLHVRIHKNGGLSS